MILCKEKNTGCVTDKLDKTLNMKFSSRYISRFALEIHSENKNKISNTFWSIPLLWESKRINYITTSTG